MSLDPEDDYSQDEDDDTIYELDDSYLKNMGVHDKGINNLIRQRYPTLE